MTTQHELHFDGHIDIDELADAGEGLLTAARKAEIDAHLSGCDQCRDNAAALAEVQNLLRTAPAETMPDDVFARLQGALTDEQARRAAASSSPTNGPSDLGNPPKVGGRFPKPHIAEHFTDTLPSRRGLRARFAAGAVGAAVIAGAVGFGGYVVSATAGTNEPSSDHQIVVATDQLSPVATDEARSGSLDAYHFSQAWRCVTSVTGGNVQGIRSISLDGKSGYLAIVKDGGTTTGVFVTGCDTGEPEVERTVDIGER